jgi:hypothetical protein
MGGEWIIRVIWQGEKSVILEVTESIASSRAPCADTHVFPDGNPKANTLHCDSYI